MSSFPKRILIVEDNKIDLRLVKDILEAHGYDTLQTGDGLEASPYQAKAGRQTVTGRRRMRVAPAGMRLVVS
jgi:CheY-like chemotaxis protein